MDRLPISANVPADLAEVMSDRADLMPIAKFREQAREELIDKLLAGKVVRTITSRDVFDLALQGPDYTNVLDLLEAALALNTEHGDRLTVAAKAKSFMESFIESKDEWVQDLAEELAIEAGK